jgi:hypothetical protein
MERLRKANRRIYNQFQRVNSEKYSVSGFKNFVEADDGGEIPIIRNCKQELLSFNAVRNILVYDDTVADLRKEAVCCHRDKYRKLVGIATRNSDAVGLDGGGILIWVLLSEALGRLVCKFCLTGWSLGSRFPCWLWGSQWYSCRHGSSI